MRKKALLVIIIILATTLLSIGITVSIMNKIVEQQKMEEWRGKDALYVFEEQLFVDSQLQEEVVAFTSLENVRWLLEQHGEKLQTLVDRCYDSKKEHQFFNVKSLEGVLFYTSKTQWVRRTENEPYEFVLDFMDYAIEHQLAFQSWMLEVEIPGLFKESYWKETENGRVETYEYHESSLLSIIIYQGSGLEVALEYSPYEERDQSVEKYAAMENDGFEVAGEVVRINSHWYCRYKITNRSYYGYWVPDMEPYREYEYQKRYRDQ